MRNFGRFVAVHRAEYPAAVDAGPVAVFPADGRGHRSVDCAAGDHAFHADLAGPVRLHGHHGRLARPFVQMHRTEILGSQTNDVNYHYRY